MSGVKKNTKVFDYIGNDVPFLRYRVGVSYPRGQAPKSVKGALRFPAPPGARFEKLYFPPMEEGIRLGEQTDNGFCGRVEYWRDSTLYAAPYGELFLNNRPRTKVTFGRFGEDKPFGFPPTHISLVTPFDKIKKFNPLYMRVNIGDRPAEYYVLDIDWGDEVIAVTFLPVDPDDCPEFLVV